MSENTLTTIVTDPWGLLLLGFVVLWAVVMSWTVSYEAKQRRKLDQKIRDIKNAKADKAHSHPWQDITGKPTNIEL